MKIRNSVKKICNLCNIFYRFKKIIVRCIKPKHKQRQK